MCTSISLTSDDNNVVLARTMDFSFQLEPEMIVVPRNVPLIFEYYQNPIEEHFAFMGLAQKFDRYYLADGINERGLSGAALYFEGYADYEYVARMNHSLCPHEVVMMVLANFQTVSEVEHFFKSITIVNHELDFLQKTPPLHWVFTDKQGDSIIVEPLEEGVKIYPNNLGVLTNSPDYNWHKTNVRNYISLQAKQVNHVNIQEEEYRPFGQGSGTFGIPGDFTPPARFIRTLYMKLNAERAKNERDLIINAQHILQSVHIIKGAVLTLNNSYDYTQYVSYMSLRSQTYIYQLYDMLVPRIINIWDYELYGEAVIVL